MSNAKAVSFWGQNEMQCKFVIATENNVEFTALIKQAIMSPASVHTRSKLSWLDFREWGEQIEETLSAKH
jgi:hypothetical protein